MVTISPAEFMASEERCEITELLVSQCAHCKHAERPAPPKARGPVFTAHYGGWCGECGGDIYEGDEITRSPDGAGYVHADCAEDA